MLTSPELVWLLAAVAKGDRPAFERLYTATCARLYGVCLRIARRADIAADAMLDAYAAIWSQAGQFDAATSPAIWMVSLARRSAIEAARRSPAAADPGEIPEGDDQTSPPLDVRTPGEGLQRVLSCIARLESDRRKLILSAYYNGWSRERLAREFGVDADAVKAWLRDSLLALRGCLNP